MSSQDTGSRPLTVDVPWQLLASPRPGVQTLVLALHGMGQPPAVLREMLAPALDLPCHWLFPRAPWPYEIRKADRMRIGHAWYQYDGDQAALRQSMDIAVRHLLGLAGEVGACVAARRLVVAGFSQGGYLAGYLAPMHPQVFSAAACIGGRIKHEFLAESPTAAHAMPLLQLHGGRDPAVKPEAARDAVEKTRALGFSNVSYHEDPQAGHEISVPMAQHLRAWLESML